MTEVEFKSPQDGSVLRFEVKARYRPDVEFDFEVSVSTPVFQARASASTYLNGSPCPMFDAMAEEWQGWKGVKSWQDLERRVTLSARSDLTGHPARC
jgi:hypothetical protein